MMPNRKREIIALFVMFAMVHACNALYVTFVPLFLTDMAFDASQRGILLSIGPFVSMLTQTMWGAAADRSRNKVRVMWILMAGLVIDSALFLASDNANTDLFLPAALRPYRVAILVTLGMMLYACFQNPMLPMIDTISMEYLSHNRSKVPYGVIRMMGTISFVIVAFLVGGIVEKSPIGTKSIFYIFFVVMAILSIALCFAPRVEGVQRGREKTPVAVLFRDKWFVVMLAAAFVVSVAYGFNGSNYSNYLRGTLGVSERIIGINSALGSTLEIFLFLMLHKIMKKTGIINLLLLCVTMATLRWLATGLFTSIPVLIAVQFCTQPFTWGILVYSIAVYIQKAVPERLHARAQTMSHMVMSSIGRIMGSLAGGLWLSAWGAGSEPRIYRCLSAVCFVTLLIAAMTFRRFGWRIGREPEALRLDADTVI